MPLPGQPPHVWSFREGKCQDCGGWKLNWNYLPHNNEPTNKTTRLTS